jgi:alpha-L-rhamnosidase
LEKSGSNFTMELVVPFNTKARVTINEEEIKSLKINGVQLLRYQNENKIEIGNSDVVLGSGIYNLEYVKSEN